VRPSNVRARHATSSRLRWRETQANERVVTEITNAHPCSTRRTRGEGGIERDRVRDRYRGHYCDVEGKRVRLAWCATRDEAERELRSAFQAKPPERVVDGMGGVSLRRWGQDFLDRR
jgi:hypothetical protein